jgi:hypothetical protein
MMFYLYIPEGICFAVGLFGAVVHVWKRAKYNNVQENSTKNSEADSFRNIKVKHHTHLKMAM